MIHERTALAEIYRGVVLGIACTQFTAIGNSFSGALKVPGTSNFRNRVRVTIVTLSYNAGLNHGPLNYFLLRSKRLLEKQSYPPERKNIYLTLLTFLSFLFNRLTSITERKTCNLSTQKIADSQRTLSLRLPL